MTTQTFRALESPDPSWSPALTALWLDANKSWDAAHDALQSDATADGAWVHAYLHRKEGDAPNAAYWYRRAGKSIFAGSLDDEWTEIAAALLD